MWSLIKGSKRESEGEVGRETERITFQGMKSWKESEPLGLESKWRKGVPWQEGMRLQ